ncbi:MAG: N-methyl-L-tryptophan oxidase [Ardenticatenaceae bacterium]|nr:N-methyl-L-tryptophan oxidase [Ardenticatenaceae bacterium]MCB9445362.1 N-methyl-L-tryptophan oxidase [Ardenticatenaceae bacterium]
MKRNYEYIVLGLGGIGSGALYWLARQAGKDVLGLEQFEIGHVRGGSQDHSRIIRLSYHTPGYVELAKAAYQAWATLEADDGAPLIMKTGGLDLYPANAAIPAVDYTNGMMAAGVPFETLSADEVMVRWPQFQLTDDVTAVYQPESGIAPAAKCNAAHLRQARVYGAAIRDSAPVTSIRDLNGEIELVAGGETYRCRKLVIAGGAWTNQALAHFNMKLPLTITQEQVVYYDTPYAADFMPDRFPIWIWMDEPSFYGFPVYGEAGPKVAQDVGGRAVTADSRSFEPDPALQARIDGFTQRLLPKAFGPPLLIKTCLYTLTPDRDFIIDTLPEHPDVALAVGAGHAFKFASAIGRILSELVMGGTAVSDLAPFRIDRPILQEENPPVNFLV